MPIANVNGIDLNYETSGDSGTPVLMIMGFSIRGAGWRFAVPALAQAHQVCIYDNRGCGHSEAPPAPYSMAEMAADAIGLMDHLGWPQAHIIGVSMGGMIAQHVALDHRDRVLSLSLIATSPGGFFNRLPTASGLPRLLSTAMAKTEEKRIPALMKLLFPKPHREALGDEWLTETLLHDLTPNPPDHGRKGQLKAVMKHDTRKRLGELEGIPTLVLKPSLDLLVRPNQSDKLHAGIPGSQLVTLEGFGHGLIRHAGTALTDPIAQHVAKLDELAS